MCCLGLRGVGLILSRHNRGISQSRIRDRYRCDRLVYCDNSLIGKSGISQIQYYEKSG